MAGRNKNKHAVITVQYLFGRYVENIATKILSLLALVKEGMRQRWQFFFLLCSGFTS